MSYDYHPGFSEAAEPTAYEQSHRRIKKAVRFIWGLQVKHPERLPSIGPYILAPNHRSLLDPFISGVVPDRAVFFMAKKEIWQDPKYVKTGLTQYMERRGAFPVDRSAKDRKAISETLSIAKGVLAEGHILGMYAEGTSRIKGQRIGKIHGGLAKISVDLAKENELEVPIIPLGATTEQLNPLYHLNVVVGEPIYPEVNGQHPKIAREEIADKLKVGLQQAVDEAYDLRKLRFIPQ